MHPYRTSQLSPLARSSTNARRERDGSTTAGRKLLPVQVCRAASTPNIVTATSVVCRSAPGSRASSRVRDTKGRKDMTRLPSLGATTLDTDVWLPSFPSGLSSSSTPASSTASTSSASNNSGRNVYTHAPGLNDAESDTDSDSGELDLARILLPPKRQQSIRSLRKHLHAAVAAEANANGGSGGSVHGRAVRPRSSHGRENVPAFGTTSNSHTSTRGRTAKAPPTAYPHMHTSTTLKMAPGLRGELHDDSREFEDALERDKRRSRRGSVDESGEWAARGLPGLKKTASAKKGASPWGAWSQGRP